MMGLKLKRQKFIRPLTINPSPLMFKVATHYPVIVASTTPPPPPPPPPPPYAPLLLLKYLSWVEKLFSDYSQITVDK